MYPVPPSPPSCILFLRQRIQMFLRLPGIRLWACTDWLLCCKTDKTANYKQERRERKCTQLWVLLYYKREGLAGVFTDSFYWLTKLKSLRDVFPKWGYVGVQTWGRRWRGGCAERFLGAAAAWALRSGCVRLTAAACSWCHGMEAGGWELAEGATALYCPPLEQRSNRRDEREKLSEHIDTIGTWSGWSIYPASPVPITILSVQTLSLDDIMDISPPKENNNK